MHDLRGEVGLAHEVASRDGIVPRDLDGYVAVGTALAAAAKGDAGSDPDRWPCRGRTGPGARRGAYEVARWPARSRCRLASTAPQTPHTTARGSAGLSHDGQTIWSCVSSSVTAPSYRDERPANENCQHSDASPMPTERNATH